MRPNPTSIQSAAQPSLKQGVEMQADIPTLTALLERVEAATAADNAIDVAIDVALFVPDERHVSARANAAGTKIVCQRRCGGADTYWAADHTLNAPSRRSAAAALRALIAQSKEPTP